jgi:phosphomannomutase
MTVVKEQEKPDPDFSTLVYPNPEDSRALDHAIGLAESKGIYLVVANDPDADRLAVAEHVK